MHKLMVKMSSQRYQNGKIFFPKQQRTDNDIKKTGCSFLFWLKFDEKLKIWQFLGQISVRRKYHSLYPTIFPIKNATISIHCTYLLLSMTLSYRKTLLDILNIIFLSIISVYIEKVSVRHFLLF